VHAPLSSPSLPAETSPPAAAPASDRIASVDTLRGLIITLMIFVNDVAGVDRAPRWLKHVGPKADGMTLPDFVFPAFLFIAGLSIPLSLGRAPAGESLRHRFAKVGGRTLTLLVMGVLMVNMESHDPWPRSGWSLLAYLAIFLAFAVVPAEPGPRRRVFQIGRIAGAIGLAALALAYTTKGGQHLVLGPLFDSTDTRWLRHSWWGILGLIGWAYAAAATIFLLAGKRREWLVGATGLLMLAFIASRADYSSRLEARAWLHWAQPALSFVESGVGWINHQVSLGEALGSLASITLAGCCLGSILLPGSGVTTSADRIRWTAVFAGGLFLGALQLDGTYGINKIGATPAWCWFCAALTAALWLLLYWLMDTKNIRQGSRFLRPAGANPLLAYVLHPFIYILGDFTGLHVDFYKDDSWPLLASLAGCFAMACLVVQLTGLIAKSGYRLKA
jgi:heparan-alpha-glucosaminide N-acetyltransferase